MMRAMRRRWAILIIAAVVVVGLLIGARAWVRGQDYVTHGSTSRVPLQARVVEDEDAAPDEPQEIAIVPYRDGARVVYGVSLRNDGPLSVEVKRVATPERPDESFFLFRTVEVRMGETSQPGTAAPEPFRPFSLGPDEERYLEVEGVLEDCEYNAPGSSTLISAQFVDFEVLGQSLEAEVTLPTTIEFRFARRAQCPREQVEP
jgi:hypothetical protein